MANPFPFVAGNVLTAAELNGIGEWTTYTPTWTASTTNPTLGNGSLVGRYSRIQNLIYVQFFLSFGSTTTPGSGVYEIGLPVTGATELVGYSSLGSGYVLDSSSANVTTVTVSGNNNTTNVIMKYTGGSFGNVSSTTPFTWTNQDAMYGSFVYKAA